MWDATARIRLQTSSQSESMKQQCTICLRRNLLLWDINEETHTIIYTVKYHYTDKIRRKHYTARSEARVYTCSYNAVNKIREDSYSQTRMTDIIYWKIC